MRLTHHAELRSTQRALPTQVLSAICTYGSPDYARGALSLTLDETSIALAAENDRRRRIELERYRGVYVILADGDRVITAARRMRRFRR